VGGSSKEPIATAAGVGAEAGAAVVVLVSQAVKGLAGQEAQQLLLQLLLRRPGILEEVAAELAAASAELAAAAAARLEKHPRTQSSTQELTAKGSARAAPLALSGLPRRSCP